ncbi:Tfp pilus assembly protein PilF [Dysgonomonas sp. PFB1-18]|uniref:hypothetical protein n=1 Tax=unclassified Dysgonomonas TaxID=2630389 RepID=UPI002475A734|nr:MULTISPECIES: hypothetical protein [unclassified Dysgonomonas]MDH6309959.1 Tfp pilus assembly protein PilF [Dysgonomonas sp. PF1-14]MDH6339869.1 Tfp pilus assembly protein PilF [Dysgonomonas sp. PF1-16]MDH6381517.1 Tfp pilus assembly protein PilF [Dysgonomonas sp. PFB1-18]MDH6398847.1 Tfp pilus assembly protein PilF [Dysgonomonas sp. PF1-23]
MKFTLHDKARLYAFMLLLSLLATSCGQQSRQSEITTEANAEIDKIINDSKPLTFNNPDSAIQALQQVLAHDKDKLSAKQTIEANMQIGLAYSIKKRIRC